MTESCVTIGALDRVERNMVERLEAVKAGLQQQLQEHDRRLHDANNAHATAVEEKRRTDEAATRIQERAVTKDDLQLWKDEVNKQLTSQTDSVRQAAILSARTWSVLMAVFVIIVNLVIKMVSP